jgi:hypothetical protein
MPRRAAAYLAVLTVGFLNLISQADFSQGAHVKTFGDATEYFRMSEQTFAPVANPFALRVLTPWLVHRIHMATGISLDSVWILVTFLATTAAVILFFELLWGHFRLSLFTSVLGTMMLAFTFNYTLYNYGNFWLVDPLNNLLYMLALRLLFTRRLGWFTLVIVIGFLNKETTLLLAPLYPLLGWIQSRTIRNRAVLLGIVATVAAGALYAAFRLWAQSRIGGDYRPLSGQNGTSIIDNIRFALNSHKTTDQWVLFGVFGFMWIVFLYGLYRLYKQVGARSELIVVAVYLFGACLLGRLVATDTERVFVMMAPMVLLIAALLFERFRGEIARLWMLTLAFLYVALNLHWVTDQAAVATNAAALVVFIVLVKDELSGSEAHAAQPVRGKDGIQL